jgi:diacylglycerol kinase (ATP)
MFSENKLFVFLNPKAGLTKADALEQKILDWGNANEWDISIHRTSIGENFSPIVKKAASDGFKIFAAAGGDGTVSEVITALKEVDFPLLIIPTGSGNVFARNFYIPSDIHRCLNLLKQNSQIIAVDLMLVNGRYRMLNAGVGFNSRLMQFTTREEKRRFGFFAYLKNIGRSLRDILATDFNLTIDGDQKQIRGADVFIANLGFGFHSWIEENEFNPNDGVVSVFVTRPSNFSSLFQILKNVLRRKKHENEVICHFNVCHEITIQSKRRLPAQADGELIGETPLTIKVIPSALNLIVPLKSDLTLGLDSINKYFSEMFNHFGG